MDDLTWNIWPCDDVMRVTEILEKNPDLIERRHGLKQETVLHRSEKILLNCCTVLRKIILNQLMCKQKFM
jgi:hypothetical protein